MIVNKGNVHIDNHNNNNDIYEDKTKMNIILNGQQIKKKNSNVCVAHTHTHDDDEK